MSDSGWMRLRVFVDGMLADEQWVDAASPDCRQDAEEVIARHAAIIAAAIDEGKRWQMEAYDPDLPAGSRYFRLGTDPRNMRRPMAAESQRQIEAEVEHRYGISPN